jgi:hypothetical protein
MNAKSKKMMWVLGGCALVLAVDSFAVKKNFDAIINFQVTDPKGAPVVDADVKARFYYFNYKPYGRRVKDLAAQTDVKGAVTLSDVCYGQLDYEVSNPAFYTTLNRMAFSRPTRTESVTLLPIINPVPMIALKKVEKHIPVLKVPIGFDLLKLDWMPPHGNGDHQDIVITADGKSGEISHWSTMDVLFDGKYNGIQSMPRRPMGAWSVMRSEYQAPSTAYLPSAVFEDTEGQAAKTTYKSADVQYFRIRSENGLNGKRGGHYGKIYGNMVEMTSKGPVLKLDYIFINPTERDHNVEFDPEQNLAPEYAPSVSEKSFQVDIP